MLVFSQAGFCYLYVWSEALHCLFESSHPIQIRFVEVERRCAREGLQDVVQLEVMASGHHLEKRLCFKRFVVLEGHGFNIMFSLLFFYLGHVKVG